MNISKISIGENAPDDVNVIIEVPMGITIREIVEDIGGGIKDAGKAVGKGVATAGKAVGRGAEQGAPVEVRGVVGVRTTRDLREVDGHAGDGREDQHDLLDG